MKKQLYLSEDWKLKGFQKGEYDIEKIADVGFDCNDWYDIQVPGDVHTTLIENNEIAHPFYKYNDLACQWVEKKVWIYRTEFDVDRDIISADCLYLFFEGLDTYCDIYLNGKKIGSFANALVEHQVDVTKWLRDGKNTLVIEFDVMSYRAAQKELPEGFWINYSTERAYTRKPGYSYGWDWSPRLATIGIWKPVSLIACTVGELEDVYIKTICLEDSNGCATLEFRVNGKVFKDGVPRYYVTITDEEGLSQNVDSDSNIFQINVKNPRLWWTHDIGTPHLYTVKVEMEVDGEIVDVYECNYGIREIRVKQKAEDGSPRFMFSLNGKDIFCRGANWVPITNFLAAAEDSTYIKLLELAKDANMNMMCLWGGGIYEKDVFYEYCDKLGILVWQYFMFACGEYPDFDDDFIAVVQDEIEKAVKRLRNHASIAIWVGNVENQMLSEKIGLQRRFHGWHLFEKLIPQWLKALDDTRLYLPSSPYGGELANSMEEGDRHNWDVWFTDIPYTDYAKDTTKFCSEFGIHAAPVRATIEKYTGITNPDIESYEFNYLNKDQSLDRMPFLMDTHTGSPTSLDQYIDYSMLVQAEGLKFGTEHYRRRFPETAGAMIWQLNDCCPCHSWSMVDYDLIPKASYYYSKRFFEPLLVSLETISPTETGIWVTNNSKDDFNGNIRVSVKDFFGNSYYLEDIEAAVPAGSSVKIKHLVVGGRFYKNVIIPCRHRNVYVSAALPGQAISKVRFFGEYKDIPMPDAQLWVSPSMEDDKLKITVGCQRFARFVKLDGDLEGLSLSDNYFNLEAGQTHSITVSAYKGPHINERTIYIKALNSEKIVIN